jgi:hypothetical protein
LRALLSPLTRRRRNDPRINARSLFAPTCARHTDYKYRSSLSHLSTHQHCTYSTPSPVIRLHKLRCYGCTAEFSPGPAESPPSPRYSVPRARYRKGECRENIPLTKSVRHYRKPRDLQMRSIGNPRAGTFLFLTALSISSSSQVAQLDATTEVGHASSC